MAHMHKETYKGTYYEVETNEGIWYVPEDVCGSVPGMAFDEVWYWDSPENDEEQGAWDAACYTMRHFIHGTKFVSIGKRKGTLCRLSAPGYLDCTEWTTDANSSEFDDTEE